MLTRKQRAALLAEASGPNRVAAAMRLTGATQVAVAQGTGLTQSWVSKIQNGQYRELPDDTQATLARFFGCSKAELFPVSAPAAPAAETADRRDGDRRAGQRRAADRRRPFERRAEAR